MNSIEEIISNIVETTIPLMEVSQALSHNEAYERGSKLLIAQGRLTNLWKQLADELIKAKASEEQAMHIAVSGAEGKDADARKAAAKANPERQAAAERVLLLENNIAYVQSFSRQFENAYRLMTYMIKGQDSGV
jgi:hypothetical protein